MRGDRWLPPDFDGCDADGELFDRFNEGRQMAAAGRHHLLHAGVSVEDASMRGDRWLPPDKHAACRRRRALRRFNEGRQMAAAGLRILRRSEPGGRRFNEGRQMAAAGLSYGTSVAAATPSLQ